MVTALAELIAVARNRSMTTTRSPKFSAQTDSKAVDSERQWTEDEQGAYNNMVCDLEVDGSSCNYLMLTKAQFDNVVATRKRHNYPLLQLTNTNLVFSLRKWLNVPSNVQSCVIWNVANFFPWCFQSIIERKTTINLRCYNHNRTCTKRRFWCKNELNDEVVINGNSISKYTFLNISASIDSYHVFTGNFTPYRQLENAYPLLSDNSGFELLCFGEIDPIITFSITRFSERHILVSDRVFWTINTFLRRLIRAGRAHQGNRINKKGADPIGLLHPCVGASPQID